MIDTNARRLADDAWARVRERDPDVVRRLGGRVATLPAGGPAGMARDVAAARHALAELDRVAPAEPASADSADPDGLLAALLAALPLEEPDDVTGYLDLLQDYVAVVDQLRTTLDEQRRRGITLPAWALDAVADTVRGHAAASAELVPDRPGTLAAGSAGRLTDAAAFASVLDAVTTGPAGDGVGIGQYPGGAECYAGLVRLHTGLDLTPERVHEIGVEEVERLTERMRSELGVVDEAAHRGRVLADARVYATDPADVARRFQGHLDRLRPHLSDLFHTLPAAPFRLRQLDPALAGGLTYGYYEPPGADGCGYYHYNGSHLAERPMLQAASMIYHEGLPGHHLQIGRQAENSALHPIRREPNGLRTFALNGYLEGWAEYAAGLCDEIGLYADPLDAYGRLCAERFQAARLVVDTGLNVLGWSRERAGEYLRVNGFLSDGEIDSELLRYTVDDPGQALGYHLGHWYLRRLRGDRDRKEFHEQVLAAGPLPLSVLGEHLARA